MLRRSSRVSGTTPTRPSARKVHAFHTPHAHHVTAADPDADGLRALGSESRPMAGEGFGLPMARIYARYFGGDLSMQSVHGHGTEVRARATPTRLTTAGVHPPQAPRAAQHHHAPHRSGQPQACVLADRMILASAHNRAKFALAQAPPRGTPSMSEFVRRRAAVARANEFVMSCGSLIP